MTWSFVVSVFEFIDNSTRATDPHLHECVEGLNSREQFIRGKRPENLEERLILGKTISRKKLLRKITKVLLNAAPE